MRKNQGLKLALVAGVQHNLAVMRVPVSASSAPAPLRVLWALLLLLLGCAAGYAATKAPQVLASTPSSTTPRQAQSSTSAPDEQLGGDGPRQQNADSAVAVRQVPQGDTVDDDKAKRTYVPNGYSKALLRAARRVGAPGADLEIPCAEYVGFECVRYALDRAFAAFDITDAAKRANGVGDDVRIVTFGNSLIASDRITNILRNRFRQRFGNGGGGFFLVDRQAEYGGRERTGYANKKWKVYNFSQGDRGRWPHGLPGVHHVTTSTGARTTWRVKGDTVGRLFWLDHKRAPTMDLYADNQHLMRIDPRRDGSLGDNKFAIPAGTQKLRLSVNGKHGVIQGLALDSDQAGAHFDSFGVVAADSRVWLGADDTLFTEGLQHRDPQLTIIMLGGNEVRRVAWGKYGYKTVRAKAQQFIERIQAAVPGSDCLVYGPLHAVRGKDHKDPFATRPQVGAINQIYREVALAQGCAFFNTYKAMGGDGALKRFYQQRMLHDDYVHPRGKGLDLLGEVLFQALMKSWTSPAETPRLDDAKARWSTLSTSMGWVDNRPTPENGRLGDDAQQLRMGVVGRGLGVDTTDLLRRWLQGRLGNAGAGWHAADKSSVSFAASLNLLTVTSRRGRTQRPQQRVQAFWSNSSEEARLHGRRRSVRPLTSTSSPDLVVGESVRRRVNPVVVDTALDAGLLGVVEERVVDGAVIDDLGVAPLSWSSDRLRTFAEARAYDVVVYAPSPDDTLDADALAALHRAESACVVVDGHVQSAALAQAAGCARATLVGDVEGNAHAVLQAWANAPKPQAAAPADAGALP